MLIEDVSDNGEGDQEDIEDYQEFNDISVPLTVVLSVIGGYIVFGTVLFGLWEGWKYMVELRLTFCLRDQDHSGRAGRPS